MFMPIRLLTVNVRNSSVATPPCTSNGDLSMRLHSGIVTPGGERWRKDGLTGLKVQE
jgi:hypothetical protein